MQFSLVVPIGNNQMQQQTHNLLQSLIKSKFLFLLLAMLTLIVAAPYFHLFGTYNVISKLLYIIIVLTVVYSLKSRPTAFLFFIILAFIDIVTAIIELTTMTHTASLLQNITFLFFCLASTAVIFHEVVMEKNVMRDTIFGAISAYLLIGITYGSAYILIENLAPGSFSNISLSPGNTSDEYNFYYFSFTTLTTLGFGDIVPLNNYAKSIVMLESITGIFFLATLVSRLITSMKA